MNTKIHKLNQYLLERYPLAWNTKILSIVGICLVVHLLFFIIGFTFYTPLDNEYNFSFGVGLAFFNVIISIIILLFWLISLYRNNAFKDYYPTSANKLFMEFIYSLVIVFFSTTFFISNQIGVFTFINLNFSEEKLEKEIERVNKGAIFLSMDKGLYTGTNKPNEISYYNYNRNFINPMGSYNDYSSDIMNLYVNELLDSPNHKEKITKILKDFLNVANKYDIKTNLTVENWLDVVYSDKETLFGVNRLISESQHSQGYSKSDLYLDEYSFSNLFYNQKKMFNKKDDILHVLYFFTWFSIIFATFIFIIRTTSLQLFLLSVVTAALISIVVGLLLFLLGVNSSNEDKFLIILIIIGLLIIISPYFLLKEKSNKLSGIIINIGFPSFPLVVIFLVVYIADFMQITNSVKLYLKDLGDDLRIMLVSLAFFIAILIFIYTRCFLVKKWKGLPEG